MPDILQVFSDWLTYGVFGLAPTSPLGSSVDFFIYDSIKVTLMLAVIVFCVGVVRSYITPQKGYSGAGRVIAIVAGIMIGRMRMENHVEDFGWKCKMYDAPDKAMTWRDRIRFGISESKSITLKVLPYILLGIGIGAVIHGYAPADFLATIAGPDNPLAVPIAVLIGIPLYSNAAGMIPIMEVLTAKGMAMGTALAFMMAVIGLSLPEMIILRKVIKIKLLALFVGILFVSFVMTGYLFNAILG